MENELKSLVGKDERIMYEGKPNKKCFVFESVFNPLLPFALIWGIIDFSFIGVSLSTGEGIAFIIPFFALHLMPVWIYLFGVLFTTARYRNTNYIVTDKAVYISSGVISKAYDRKPFAEMSHVDLHRGIFDQQFGVGDILISSAHMSSGSSSSMQINSISDYTEVYNMIKKLQEDIYSDIMYPNDLRPEENHGYNTKYRG